MVVTKRQFGRTSFSTEWKEYRKFKLPFTIELLVAPIGTLFPYVFGAEACHYSWAFDLIISSEILWAFVRFECPSSVVSVSSSCSRVLVVVAIPPNRNLSIIVSALL